MSTNDARHDRIILQGMRFYAYHGLNPEERTLGQPFEVDLEAEMDLTISGRSDRKEDTVSYTHLYRKVKEVMEGPSKNLLETLAETIAQRVLETYPVTAVRVQVKKTRPPIKGAFLANAGVEICRQRT